MRHIDEGAMLALLDDEMGAEEARDARVHLEICTECRAAYESLEEEAGIFAVAVAAVDREPHLLEARAAISRGRRRSAPPRAFVRAAALVLLAAGVASATVPGSPVRDWLRGVTAPPAPAPETPEALVNEELPVEPLAGEAAPREAGISILPAQGSIRVLLVDAGSLTVRARLTDDERAGVHVYGRAAGARFATAEGLIRVSGAQHGQMEIVIPRTARRATLELDGVILLYKDGERLHLSAAEPTGEVQIVVDE
jgi:hypothetical protein